MLLKDKNTCWSGVRNYTARNNLKAMKKGDKAFFYHSGEGLCIVGIAEVVKEGYPDPTDKLWTAVDFAPVKTLKKPVTLQQIKAEKKLADIALVKQGRLSVSSLKKEEFEAIVKMSE
jgi:predicted RNA-binding protein with PUA-like domain